MVSFGQFWSIGGLACVLAAVTSCSRLSREKPVCVRRPLPVSQCPARLCLGPAMPCFALAPLCFALPWLRRASPSRVGSMLCFALPLPRVPPLCRCLADIASPLPCTSWPCLRKSSSSYAVALPIAAQLCPRFAYRCCAKPSHRNARPLLIRAEPSLCKSLLCRRLATHVHAIAKLCNHRHSPAARPLAFATLPSAEPLLRFAALCLRCATLGFALASHCKPLLCPRAAMLAVAMPLLCMSSRSNPTPWRRRTQPSRRSAGLCRRDSSRS